MGAKSQLLKLRKDIERIDGRLNRDKTKKTKEQESEASLARRRVAAAKNRVEFLRSQTPAICDVEIVKLQNSQRLLAEQIAALDTRISWWADVRDNREQLLADAQTQVAATETYRDGMFQATVEEKQQATMDKIKALQEGLAKSGITIEDLQKVYG